MRRTIVTPKRMIVLTAGLAVGSLLGGCGDGAVGTAEPRMPDVGVSTTAKVEEGRVGSDTSAPVTAPDAGSLAPPTSPQQGQKLGDLGNGQSVTLAFAGDASFQGLGGAATADPSGLLSAIAPVLGDADLTMVNLETALGPGGSPEAKTFKFQAPAAVLDALGSAGVDIVSMANNHGMDYGLGGLQSTLQIKSQAKIHVLGIGSDSTEAYAPYIAQVHGQRIGFLALNDVFDSNLIAAWTAGDDKPGIASAKPSHAEVVDRAVRSLRQKVDTLVVFLHFGTETQTCPNERQKALVDQLTASGADIVVGSHAHRLQGVGFQGDKLVAYGLGNFIFQAPSAPGRKSGVLKVRVRGRTVDSFEWVLAEIRSSLPVPLSGGEAESALADMRQLQNCAGLSSLPPVDSTTKGE